MSSQTVEIRITGQNLAGPAFQSLERDLKGVDAAAGNASRGFGTVGQAAQRSTGAVAGITTAFSSLKGVVAGAGLALGIDQAATAMIAFGVASVQAASALNENLNKVEVVFDNLAGAVKTFADDAATSLGMSESAALDATGTFGNLFTSMGMGRATAAEMSMSIVQLAADLGSFNNIGTAEALEKIRAGLVGETEPLRALGVNLSAAAIEARALEMGLARTADALTPAMKAQAAYALILEQTTNAQGDFARTADSAANRMKTASASIDDLKATIGSGLLPMVGAAAAEITTMAQSIVTLAEAGDRLMASVPGGSDGLVTGFLGHNAEMFTGLGNIKAINIVLEELAGLVDDGARSESLFNNVLIEGNQLLERRRALLAEESDIVFDHTTVLANLADKQRELTIQQREYEETLGRQAVYAGEANERAAEHFLTMEQGAGVVAEAAYATAKLAEAQAGLSGAYQINLEMQGQFNSQASEYQSQADTIRKAIELWGEELANGSMTQEEYNRKVALGEAAIQRYEGGVRDATMTAGDYAIANSLIMGLQDQINAQFPDLVAGSSEYNAKLKEMALAAGMTEEEFNAMMASGSGTNAVIAGLTEAITLLIAKLNEIDGKTANATVTVTTEYITNGAPPSNSIGIEAFAEGGLVTQPTLGIVGEAGPELIIPLNKLPEAARRDVLSGGATGESAVKGEAGWKPFLDDLMGWLGDAASAFDGEGLEHAQAFARAAGDAVALVSDTLGLLLALSEATVSYGPDIADKVAQLKFMSEHVATSIADSAALFEGEAVAHAGDYARAASDAVGLLADALALQQSLAGVTVSYGPEIAEAISALKFMSEHVTRSIADSAATMDGPFLEHAETYAAATRAAFGLLSDALEFVELLADQTALGVVDHETLWRNVTRLAIESRMIASVLQSTLPVWEDEVAPAFEAYGQAVGAATGSLADTLGFIRELASDTETVLPDHETIWRNVTRLAIEARMIASVMQSVAGDWDGSVNPALEDFAAAAGASLDVISGIGDALAAIAEWGESDLDLAGLAPKLAADIDTLVQAAEQANALWQERGAPSLVEFAESAGATLDVMSAAVDVFAGMAEQSELTAQHADVFRHNLGVVVGLIPDLLALVQPLQDDATQLAEIMQAVADAMQAANSAIQAVGGGTSGSGATGGTHSLDGVGGGRGGGATRGTPVIQINAPLVVDGIELGRIQARHEGREMRRTL